MKKESMTVTANNTKNRIWNAVFISAFLVNMMIQFCVQTMNTLVGKFANYLGATATVVGLVSSLFALTALVFKLVSAPMIDTFHRKYVLLGAMGVTFLAMVCYSFSHSIQLLIVARLLQGTGQAFTTTCCLTIASDSLPEKKMGTGIGYFALGAAIVQSFAPTVGLKLFDLIGYNQTFAVLAGVMLMAMIYACTMRIEHREGKKFSLSLQSVIAKEAVVPAALLFFLSMSSCVVNAFLVIFAEERGVMDIGYFFTVMAITMFVTRPLIGRLADKLGSAKVIIPGLLCYAASFLLISFSHSLPMFLLAAFVSAFGYGGCQPAIQAMAMRAVPTERRGAASCTSYIGTDLGNLVGPVIAGAVVEAFGYTNMWRIMILPMVCAGAVMLSFRRHVK